MDQLHPNKNYSLFSLLDKYYNAKKAYYSDGKNVLTDQEFDKLEENIAVLHSDVFNQWKCVGYDPNKHKIIQKRIKEERDAFKKMYNK